MSEARREEKKVSTLLHTKLLTAATDNLGETGGKTHLRLHGKEGDNAVDHITDLLFPKLGARHPYNCTPNPTPQFRPFLLSQSPVCLKQV